MSTLKERINKYLAHASDAQSLRQREAVLAEFEDFTFRKDRARIDLQHEQESLKLLEKRFQN